MAPEDIAIEAWDLFPLEQDGTDQPSTNIPSFSHFLRLPRELRDMIYVYYARVDGGLFYNSYNDTMRVASGQVLDPSLALTCPQVACEMEGIAVKANTISFSTVYNEASSQRAEMFHYAMRDIAEEKSKVVNKMAPCLLTLDDAKEVVLLYPQFQPILDRWTKGVEIRENDWLGALYGEAASFKRDFVDYILNLMVLHPDFPRVASAEGISRGPAQTLSLACSHPDPWSIPERSEVANLVRRSRSPNRPERFSHNGNIDFAYSAAAVAIDYLRSLSDVQRRALRTIILIEDHEAVAHSESHARGLISCCRQYKDIRVERRVSLWRCIPPVNDERHYMLWQYSHRDYVRSNMVDPIHSSMITRAVSLWITEAMILPSLGMPDGSFNLVIDGSPTPEAASRIFDIVLHDTASQSALDNSYRHRHPELPLHRGSNDDFTIGTSTNIYLKLSTVSLPIDWMPCFAAIFPSALYISSREQSRKPSSGM